MCDVGKQIRARWCRQPSLDGLASFLSEMLSFALRHTEGLEPCCMNVAAARLCIPGVPLGASEGQLETAAMALLCRRLQLGS